MLQVEATIEDKQQRHNVEAPFNVNSFILKSPLMSKREKKEEKTSNCDTASVLEEKKRKTPLCDFHQQRDQSREVGDSVFFVFFFFV